MAFPAGPNYSLKRTAAYRRLCYHAVTRQRPLSSSVSLCPVSVDQTRVVDAIGTDRADGTVVLTVFDHLAWDDAHFPILQEKISTYLHFLESGEVYESYPSAVGRTFAISVALLHRPGEEGFAFLQRIGAAVTSAGYAFRFGPLPSGYEGDSG